MKAEESVCYVLDVRNQNSPSATEQDWVEVKGVRCDTLEGAESCLLGSFIIPNKEGEGRHRTQMRIRQVRTYSAVMQIKSLFSGEEPVKEDAKPETKAVADTASPPKDGVYERGLKIGELAYLNGLDWDDCKKHGLIPEYKEEEFTPMWNGFHIGVKDAQERFFVLTPSRKPKIQVHIDLSGESIEDCVKRFKRDMLNKTVSDCLLRSAKMRYELNNPVA